MEHGAWTGLASEANFPAGFLAQRHAVPPANLRARLSRQWIASRASAIPSRAVHALIVVHWRSWCAAAFGLGLVTGAEPASSSATANVRML